MSSHRSVLATIRSAPSAPWPMGCILPAVLLTSMFCEALYVGLSLLLPELPHDSKPLTQFHLVRDGFLVLAAFAYGKFRVLVYHPVVDEAYYEWLTLTPWHVNKPLPMGPVHLVWQDAALLAVLMLLASYRPFLSPAAIPLALLTGYLAILVWTHILTGPTWIAYAILLGLALALRALWWSPWAALAVVAGLLAFSQVALRISLAGFPWQPRLDALHGMLPRDNTQREFVFKRSTRPCPPETQFADIRGLWPMSVLHVDQRERQLSPADLVAISLVVGTWVACATAGLPPNEEELRNLLHGAVLAFPWVAALVRLGTYISRHPCHLGIVGRAVTGQWIIPSYDVVYLTPFAVVGVGLLTYGALVVIGAPHFLLLSATVTGSLLVAFLGGPDRRRWQLTCPVRLNSKPVGVKTAVEI